jgi:hypothetical protein
LNIPTTVFTAIEFAGKKVDVLQGYDSDEDEVMDSAQNTPSGLSWAAASVDEIKYQLSLIADSKTVKHITKLMLSCSTDSTVTELWAKCVLALIRRWPSKRPEILDSILFTPGASIFALLFPKLFESQYWDTYDPKLMNFRDNGGQIYVVSTAVLAYGFSFKGANIFLLCANLLDRLLLTITDSELMKGVWGFSAQDIASIAVRMKVCRSIIDVTGVHLAIPNRTFYSLPFGATCQILTSRTL